jgi:signal peptidase I
VAKSGVLVPGNTDDRNEPDWLRQAVDLIVCFIIAVILLRTFILEGYLISTGSMAPGLFGFHKRVVCPSCQHTFAFGVSFDESVDPLKTPESISDNSRKHATCPNCGQINIDVTDVPVSHGDQLLVLKHAYDFRPPRRWETVVFRNPASPGEAYVKRVVGLPGDELLVRNGDVFSHGELLRKDYRAQKGTRILVSDLKFLADSPLWEMPWQLSSGWEQHDGVLETVSRPAAGLPSAETPVNEPPVNEAEEDGDSPGQNVSRLSFRHWRWYGGTHFVETPLSRDAASADWNQFQQRFSGIPLSWATRLDYDAEHEVLRCEGVMPLEMQQDLVGEAVNPEFRRAIFRLAALSHLAPVTDRYGYNSLVSSPEFAVNDLMLRTVLSWKRCPQQIRVQVPIAADVYLVSVDFSLHKVFVYGQDETSFLREYELVPPTVPPSEQKGDVPGKLELEVSGIDSSLLIALNGQAYPVAVEIPVRAPSGETASDHAEKSRYLATVREQQNRWMLEIEGSGVRVEELQMFRDIYYTPGRRRNAVNEECRIPPDSYLMLGDNSPVSADSRNWVQPCVPHRMLLGKPFLLHLPSKPAVLEVGESRWPIRIPEWSRIRYIP